MLTKIVTIAVLCMALATARVTSEKVEQVSSSRWSNTDKNQARKFDWSLMEKQRSLGRKIEESPSLLNTFLRGVSMLQFGGASQYFVSSFYTVDGATIQSATAKPLNLCLLYPDSPYYQYATAVLSSDGSQITVTQKFYTDAACSVTAPPPTETYLFPTTMTSPEPQACSHGDDYVAQLVDIKVTSALISSTNPFANFGAGDVTSSYSNADNCANQVALNQNFDSAFSCQTSVANSVCTPVNQSLTIISSNSFLLSTYTDKTCTSVERVEQVTSYDNICYSHPSDDDHGYIYFYSSVLQGGSSSSDDDSVTLSQSTYGGLIAAVFIALTFGIACTAGLFCFGIISVGGAKNRALSNQGL
jgi:hypothetical protein